VALEKLDTVQVASFAPPLPQRAYTITGYGSTTELANFAGSSEDGVRYGYFQISTSQFSSAGNGRSTPPLQSGEKFQVWTAAVSGASFPLIPTYTPDGAPDLFNVYDLLHGTSSSKPVLTLKSPTLRTVIGVVQNSGTTWTVYYADIVTANITPGADGIVTVPMPYNGKWLGEIGHVAGVNYTYSLPGGPDQFTCVLQVPPDYRTDAMDPGRIIQAYKGGSCIWEGQLTEPQPAATGWTITANGVATYGTNYAAYYSAWNSDDPVNKAIGRGLRWQNVGIGNPPGIYLGPQQDPGSMTITDFLNLLCTGGALTWQLVPGAGTGFPAPPWIIQVVPFPTDVSGNPLISSAGGNTGVEWMGHWKRSDLANTLPRIPPDLYLVNTNPVARTINSGINTVVLRYQKSADKVATSTAKAQAATFGTTYADIPSSVAAHGRLEYYLDITNAGTKTEAQAVQIGLNMLHKYIRASFAGSFTVQPGQLVNNGGVPVDLGCNWGGAVVTVQVNNAAYGGEVSMAPLTFIVGQYEYDDDTQTANISPFQFAATDMSSVVSMLWPGKFA
jgi:hypothetical protein